MFQLMRVTSRSTVGAVQLHDAHPVGGHVGDVALLQDDDVLGVLQDGRHVAGQESLAAPETHDQRHVHARSDDPIGMRGVHDADGVGAPHALQRPSHRLHQVAVVLLLDEVRQHLGIGLGGEPMACGQQPVLDLAVVLDDPVMDQRQLAAAVRCGDAR